MTEEVPNSWEDIIDENGEIADQLQDMRLSKSAERSKKQKPPSTASPTSVPNISVQQDHFRILQRPEVASTTSNESLQTNQRAPQTVVLENNTRTQPTPQVKILKRPDHSSGLARNASTDNNTGSARSQTLTYEEREANYAKARQRILGSAKPDYQEADSIAGSTNKNPVDNGLVKTNLKNASSLNMSQPSATEVPILRHPQGPDGSRGFNVKR